MTKKREPLPQRMYLKSLLVAVGFAVVLYVLFVITNIFSIIAGGLLAFIFKMNAALIILKISTRLIATIIVIRAAINLASKVEKRPIPNTIKYVMVLIICINWMMYLGLARFIDTTQQQFLTENLTTKYRDISIANEKLTKIDNSTTKTDTFSSAPICEYTFDIVNAPSKDELNNKVTLMAGISARKGFNVQVGQTVPPEFLFGPYGFYTDTLTAYPTDKNPPFSKSARLVLKSIKPGPVKVARDFSVYVIMIKYNDYQASGTTAIDYNQPVLAYYKLPTTVDWSLCDFVQN